MKLFHQLGVFAILMTMSGPTWARDCNGSNTPFHTPETVTIRGYNGDAMEPFIARDGKVLFFNNRNDPSTDTNIFYADRIDDLNFQFQGEMPGINSPALDAVASATGTGEFYFISTRSYDKILATIYRGQMMDGKVMNVELVRGIAGASRGHIDFDAEISPDGRTLFYVDGIFSGNAYPDSAEILVATRTASGFSPLPNAHKIMENINEGVRQYAPAISNDGREIFFTRLDKFLFAPRTKIYRAVWDDHLGAFGKAEHIDAITGLAEGPTLSPDSCSLYYHVLENEHYIIKRVTR